MAATTPSNNMIASSPTRKPLVFMANAAKNKKSFVQFFFMTGILMLSLRSLGQKYRIHDLTIDTTGLREEGDFLSLRMAAIKEALFDEASKDSSGVLDSHLRSMFEDKN